MKRWTSSAVFGVLLAGGSAAVCLHAAKLSGDFDASFGCMLLPVFVLAAMGTWIYVETHSLRWRVFWRTICLLLVVSGYGVAVTIGGYLDYLSFTHKYSPTRRIPGEYR